MVCDVCKERDAAVHLTTIEDNAVHQLHLCEKCAAERGVETPAAAPNHPLGEFLHDVQQQVALTGLTSGRSERSTVIPSPGSCRAGPPRARIARSR